MMRGKIALHAHRIADMRYTLGTRIYLTTTEHEKDTIFGNLTGRK